MEHDQARPRTTTHKNNQVRKINVLRNDTKISLNKHAKNISRRPTLGWKSILSDLKVSHNKHVKNISRRPRISENPIITKYGKLSENTNINKTDITRRARLSNNPIIIEEPIINENNNNEADLSRRISEKQGLISETTLSENLNTSQNANISENTKARRKRRQTKKRENPKNLVRKCERNKRQN